MLREVERLARHHTAGEELMWESNCGLVCGHVCDRALNSYTA